MAYAAMACAVLAWRMLPYYMCDTGLAYAMCGILLLCAVRYWDSAQDCPKEVSSLSACALPTRCPCAVLRWRMVLRISRPEMAYGATHVRHETGMCGTEMASGAVRWTGGRRARASLEGASSSAWGCGPRNAPHCA
eukprot:3743794-Rhodomonas_salina.1